MIVTCFHQHVSNKRSWCVCGQWTIPCYLYKWWLHIEKISHADKSVSTADGIVDYAGNGVVSEYDQGQAIMHALLDWYLYFLCTTISILQWWSVKNDCRRSGTILTLMHYNKVHVPIKRCTLYLIKFRNWKL